MIVIDASALVDAFVGHERLEILATEELHAPASIDGDRPLSRSSAHAARIEYIA